MVGLVLLCAMEMSFAFVTAWGLTRLVGSCALGLPVQARLSYGGTMRYCAPTGGVVLSWAIACALLPLVWIRGADAGLPAFLVLLGLAGATADRAARRNSPFICRIVLILILMTVPASLLPWIAAMMVAAAFLFHEFMLADLVAGVPASLFAPVLAGGGAFLVFQHRMDSGLVGLAAAGALIAVHAFHRFPPRLVLGTSGAVVLASITLWMMGDIAAQQSWFAFAVLTSFTSADLACRILNPRSAGVALSFEHARRCGEPEAGLALAAGSLSSANVVLVWAFADAWPALQGAAAALSLLLAFQFRRFLARASARRPA